MSESYQQPELPWEESKFCRGCDRVFPLSSFGEKTPGKLRSRCKDCVNAWYRRYRKEHREQKKEAEQRYVENNRGKVAERRRRYHEKNRDRINAKVAEWKAAHPERARQTNARSRAKRQGADGFVSTADFEKLCERYGNRCLCCGATGVKPTWDHIIPLSKGGEHHIDNIQPLCASCNSRKGTASTDFREGKFGIGG